MISENPVVTDRAEAKLCSVCDCIMGMFGFVGAMVGETVSLFSISGCVG